MDISKCSRSQRYAIRKKYLQSRYEHDSSTESEHFEVESDNEMQVIDDVGQYIFSFIAHSLFS